MTKSPVAVLVLLSIVLASAAVAAHPMVSSGSTAGSAAFSTQSNDSNATSSVWDPNDSCSQDEWSDGCFYPVTCSECLSRSGCAVESTTGKCVSIDKIETTTASTVGTIEYFLSGEATYCDADDAACAACQSMENSTAVCKGKNSCVCMYECETISTEPTECLAKGMIAHLTYFLFGIIFLLPLSLCIHMGSRRHSRYASAAWGLTRMVRRRPTSSKAQNPMTLKLDNWRHHLEEHQEQFKDVELQRCHIDVHEGGDAETQSEWTEICTPRGDEKVESTHELRV